MAVFKCKMCGGTLEVQPGESVAVCDSCGSKQTIPNLSDDRKANLFDRANHFRRANEFDKAMNLYEQILNEDNSDAEAHWGVVLCRYGIEYVEDPATHKRMPTVNRAQFSSVFADEDYKAAMQYADGYQRDVYETEAKAIEEIQKGILAISQKEEPFDVFISFKETDANGRRTPDTVLANELYHQLTQEGFKVFFAPITLEDKLGSEYEPYIFAALNSSKAMVVLGTKPEYFNAVWVKNEWSRYLALIKNGAKKTLIPAFKDMDPYDLPEEFSHLMAQDMSKLGFMQDLIRGIKKIASAEVKTAPIKETVTVQTAAPASNNIAPLLERAFMALEDGDWQKADEFCEQVLNQEPRNAQAYLGKLMAELHVPTREDLKNCDEPFDNSNNYAKSLRFCDEALKKELESANAYIRRRNEKNDELIDAVMSNNIEAVKQLLSTGADANCDFFGDPILICAIQDENVEIVKLLLENGADPNSEKVFGDGDRFCALSYVFFLYWNETIATLLIEAGADVNCDYIGNPILIEAIRKNNVKMVKLFLEKGADPNCERKHNDGSRSSALSDSILAWPNNEIAVLLIEAGADVNYCNNVSGANYNVLIGAIANGNVKMVKLLLEKGADPNCERVLKDGSRCSALHDSIVERPNDEIAALLIEAGADVNYYTHGINEDNKLTVPILIEAIAEGNVKMVKLLLEKGADPNCERKHNSGSRFSALSNSVEWFPNDEIAALLIEAGADVNYCNNASGANYNVLIGAIANGNVKMVKLLLENGADPNCERVLKDGRKFSALRDSICQWPDNRIVDLLVTYMKDLPNDIKGLTLNSTSISAENKNSLKKAGCKFHWFS